MGELTERFERKTILSNGKGSDSRRYNSERLSVLYSYYQLYIMCIMNDRFLSSFFPPVFTQLLLRYFRIVAFSSFLLLLSFFPFVYSICETNL